MQLRKIFVLLLVFLFSPPVCLFALTLDYFEGAHIVSSSPGESNASTIADPLNSSGQLSVLGGYRTIRVDGITGSDFLKTTLLVSSGFISHSQDINSTGSSIIIWDGDANDALNPTGLGGIDFTQDGSSKFVIDVLSYDYPASKAIDLEVIAYSDANSVSSAIYNLNHLVSSTESVEIPYTDFVKLSSVTAPVDFTSVGAIKLIIHGTVKDADLALSLIGTDGCDLVPDANGVVIDECGVCGGDGASCADCAGTPNGVSVIDVCGICDGDGNSCLDCNGVPFGKDTVDACGICGGNGISCLNCNSYNQSDLLRQLDGGAKIHEALIIKMAHHLRRKATVTVDLTSFIRGILNKTNDLQIENWTLSWTLPVEVNLCDLSAHCEIQSLESILELYRENSKKLKKQGRKLARKQIDMLGYTLTRMKRYMRQSRQIHRKNMELADRVPVYQSAC